MSARTILNPPLINELNELFSGTGTSELSCSSLTINNTAGEPVSTLGNALNGVLGITNKDTTSVVPNLVVQLINGNDVFCNLGVGDSQDILQVGSGSSGSVGAASFSVCSDGLPISTIFNALNGVLGVKNEDTGSDYANGALQLVNANDVICNLGVGDSQDILQVGSNSGGTVSAASYIGGIGCLNESISIPAMGPFSVYTVNVIIPNFIGSASSIYVASLNASSVVAVSNTIAVSYTGPSGTGTEVIVVITNPANDTISAYDAHVNIITMNPPVL